MYERPDRIPLVQCQDRHVYRLFSRNLSFGVFRMTTRGFIGIRRKFDSRYLFEEYHWDTGAPHGTANPLEDVGVLPDDLKLESDLGTIDSVTRRVVDFNRDQKSWYFVDTGEFSKAIRAVLVRNTELFDFLDAFKSERE